MQRTGLLMYSFHTRDSARSFAQGTVQEYPTSR